MISSSKHMLQEPFCCVFSECFSSCSELYFGLAICSENGNSANRFRTGGIKAATAERLALDLRRMKNATISFATVRRGLLLMSSSPSAKPLSIFHVRGQGWRSAGRNFRYKTIIEFSSEDKDYSFTPPFSFCDDSSTVSAYSFRLRK